MSTNNKDNLDKWYSNMNKRICRLYSGYTPVWKIEKLLHDLETAYHNELRKLAISEDVFIFNHVYYWIRVYPCGDTIGGYTANVYRDYDNLVFCGDTIYYDPVECQAKTTELFYDYASDQFTS